MEKKSDQELISSLDSMTKQGQRQQVLKELDRLLKSNPSTDLRPGLARIANRNHAYVLALRILHPMIRDDRDGIAVASSDALGKFQKAEPPNFTFGSHFGCGLFS